MKPAGAGFYVVCLDHEAGPFISAEAAVRRSSAISELGVCTLEHEVKYYASYRETRDAKGELLAEAFGLNAE